MIRSCMGTLTSAIHLYLLINGRYVLFDNYIELRYVVHKDVAILLRGSTRQFADHADKRSKHGAHLKCFGGIELVDIKDTNLEVLRVI